MIKGLILAAGRGRRLDHLTADRPKPLVQVGGLSLAERALRSLRAGGITDIHLVVGYHAERFDFLRLPVVRNSDWAETGIFRSLSMAAEILRSGSTVVAYGDIFFAAEDIKRLAAAPGDIVVAFDPAAAVLWGQRFPDPLADLENFRIDAGGRCTLIGGRLEAGAPLDGQFTGLFKLTAVGWVALARVARELPGERWRTIDMTSLLACAIAAGVTVDTIPLSGPWGEVDQPSDISLYERIYFRKAE